MSQNNDNADQIELGALWKKDTQNGKMLSGRIKRASLPAGAEDIEIVIFTNKFKKADNHPDFRIYLARPRGGVGVATAAPTTAAKKTTPAVKQQPVAAPAAEEDNDII